MARTPAMTRVVALATALTVSLNGVGLSAQSAPRPAAAPSPFSRGAIARAVANATDAPETIARQGKNDWARLAGLTPGSDITLTVTGAEPVARIFVHADEMALTVLRVNDSVPPAVLSVLRDMATLNPAQLMSLTKTGSWTDTRNNLRIGPEGVTVSGKRIAALTEFVLRIEKPDVDEVAKGLPKRRSVARNIGGFFLGYFGGGLLIGGVANAAGADPSNIGWPILGGLACGIITPILLSRWAAPKLVYRR
jgi:hypothetical protein